MLSYPNLYIASGGVNWCNHLRDRQKRPSGFSERSIHTFLVAKKAYFQIPKRSEHFYRNIQKLVLIAALLIIAPNWRQSKQPLTGHGCTTGVWS